MTDPIHDAAQALLDAIDWQPSPFAVGTAGVLSADQLGKERVAAGHRYNDAVAALRGALAARAQPTNDDVLWEGETVAIPDGSVKVSAIPGPFPHPPGTRVRVVRATDQPSEDQPSREQLLALIGELTDDGPCHYDHHGYCQGHSLDPAPCPHARAKELLAADQPSEDQP